MYEKVCHACKEVDTHQCLMRRLANPQLCVDVTNLASTRFKTIKSIDVSHIVRRPTVIGRDASTDSDTQRVVITSYDKVTPVGGSELRYMGELLYTLSSDFSCVM